MNNEEALVEWLNRLFPCRKDVLLGIGDDTAALDLNLPGGLLLLAAADQVIEQVHATPDTPPEIMAQKLLNRNVSDIAAMGGTPTHALVTLALNPLEESFLTAFHQGLKKTADRWNMSVIGGDVSTLPAPGKVLSLTILGTVPKDRLCRRDSAEEGDFLYMTGKAGNSFLSGHHLHFTPRIRESAFLAGTWTQAMIDVSDGIRKDAERMAAASGLSVEIHPENLPLREGAVLPDALSDGEDYELLFAVHPDRAADLERIWPFQDVNLTRIGIFRGKNRINMSKTAEEKHGYDCFKRK